MHKRTFSQLAYIILLSALAFHASAQTLLDPPSNGESLGDMLRHTNTAYLLDFAKKDSIRYYADRERAIQVALAAGQPIRGRFNGASYSLQGFDAAGQLSYFTTDNSGSAQVIRTNQVHPGGSAGLGLTGASILNRLCVWEVDRPRLTHVELTGRIVQADGSIEPIDDHASHVSGTMIAAGVNNNAKGMAFQTNLRAFDVNNHVSEMTAEAAANRYLSNHSYGSYAGWVWGDFSGQIGWHWWGSTTVSQTIDFKFGQYDQTARDWDNIMFNAPFFLPVKSSGNSRGAGPSSGAQHWVRNAANQWVSSTTARQINGGTDGYDCIPTYGNAKNILTIGSLQVSGGGSYSLAGSSSTGPTDDGRIKPDLVAKGVNVFSATSASNNSYDNLSGTSMAAPAIAGSLLLLLEHYANLNPGFTIRASALKALAIHTAEQLGAGNAPNYRTGWGIMDTRAAADLLTESFQTNGRHRLRSRDTLYNNGTVNLTYYHDGQSPFKVTIAWADPPGPVQGSVLNPTTSRLVNDLDLRVIRESDNTTYSPYRLNPSSPAAAATKGDNFRDNVEQVFEESLPPGNYIVRVTHKGTLSGGFQIFSTVVSGRAPQPQSSGCEQAATISCGQTVTATTSGTAQNVPNCDTELNTAPGRWYRYTAGQTGQVTVSTCNLGTNFDTKIGVFSGTCTNLVCVGGNDDDLACPNNESTVQFNATAGQNYYIYITGWQTESGTFVLSITCGGSGGCVPAPYPPSDPVYQAVIAEDPYCCNVEWDDECQDLYDVLSGGGGSGLNMATAINLSPLPVVQNQPASAVFNVINNNSSTFNGEISLDLYDGNGNYLLEIESKTGLSLCAGCSFSSNLAYNFTLNQPPGNYIMVVWYRPAGGAWTEVGDGNFNNTLSFEIVNQPQAVLTASPTSFSFPETAGSGNLVINSNISWSISGAPAWLNITPSSSGSGGATLTLNHTANNSPTPRSATLTLAGGSLSQQIPVTQAGCTLPTVPQLNQTGTVSICSGQSTTLSVNNPCQGCTITWSNGQTGTSINVSSAGTYTATAANNCGSSAASQAVVVAVSNAPSAPSIAANGSTALCPGQSIQLTASNVCNGCTVNWSNGQNGASITVSAPGDYTATVMGSCGSSVASNTVTITSQAAAYAPNVTITGPSTICANETTTLTASNICPGCTISWSNGQTGTSITVSATGTYTATASNICGASTSSNTVTVSAGTVPNAGTVTATGSTVLCEGQAATLSANMGACVGCTVNWSNGQTGNQIVVITSGDYWFTVSNNCGTSPMSNIISIMVNPLPQQPTISASGPTVLCPGQSVVLTAANVCSGCNVVWSNGQTGNSIAVSTPGLFTAMAQNACGQSGASNSIQVEAATVPTVPQTSVSGTQHLCLGQSLSISVLNICTGCTVSWSNGQTGSPVNITAPGTYTAMLINACGQQGPVSSQIIVVQGELPPQATVSPSGTAEICSGQSVTLTANGCSACSGVNWSNGATGPSITVSAPGSYTASYVNACGSGPASLATQVFVTSYTPEITVNNQCYLAAPNGSNYQWFFNGVAIDNAVTQFLVAQETGYYTVNMTGTNGCTGTSAPLFIAECAVSVQEMEGLAALSVFPNPAASTVFFEFLWENAGPLRLDLLAVDGRLLATAFNGTLPAGTYRLPAVVDHLPTGVYLYRLTGENGLLTGKLVVGR